MTRRASYARRGVPSAPRLRRRTTDRTPLEVAVLAATALLEVRDGRRDSDQLADLVDARVARQLAALVRRRRGTTPTACAPTLRRVVVDASHVDTVNVVVVLDCHDRVVPVSVEVQRHADTWRITSLATPGDHRPDAASETDRPEWEEPTSIEPW